MSEITNILNKINNIVSLKEKILREIIKICIDKYYLIFLNHNKFYDSDMSCGNFSIINVTDEIEITGNLAKILTEANQKISEYKSYHELLKSAIDNELNIEINDDVANFIKATYCSKSIYGYIYIHQFKEHNCPLNNINNAFLVHFVVNKSKNNDIEKIYEHIIKEINDMHLNENGKSNESESESDSKSDSESDSDSKSDSESDSKSESESDSDSDSESDSVMYNTYNYFTKTINILRIFPYNKNNEKNILKGISEGIKKNNNYINTIEFINNGFYKAYLEQKDKIFITNPIECLKEWRKEIINSGIIKDSQKYIKIIPDEMSVYRALATLIFKKNDNNTTQNVKLDIFKYMLKTFFDIDQFKKLGKDFIYKLVDINTITIFKDNKPKDWAYFWKTDMKIEKIIKYNKTISLDANVYNLINLLNDNNKSDISDISECKSNIIIYMAESYYKENICINRLIIENKLKLVNFPSTENLVFFKHKYGNHFDVIININKKNQTEFKCDNITLTIINDDIINYADEDTIFLDTIDISDDYDKAFWNKNKNNSLYEYAIKNNKIISNTKISESILKNDYIDISNGKAKYIKYENCSIIYIKSNNFTQYEIGSDLENELKKSYSQIYEEYKNIKDVNDFRMVSLLNSPLEKFEKIINKIPKIICKIFEKIKKPIKIYLYEKKLTIYKKLINLKKN